MGDNLLFYGGNLDILRGRVGRSGIDCPPQRHTSQRTEKASKVATKRGTASLFDGVGS